MKEQVLTITTSAPLVSLVICTPSFSSVPSIISASTRFLAQPSEINPTRNGRSVDSCVITDHSAYGMDTAVATFQSLAGAIAIPNCAKSFVTREGLQRAAKAYVAPEVGLPWQNE